MAIPCHISGQRIGLLLSFEKILGQVQKIWPEIPYSSERLGKCLFIVAGVLKMDNIKMNEV